MLEEADAKYWKCYREKKQLPLAPGWWVLPAAAIGTGFWLALFWALA